MAKRPSKRFNIEKLKVIASSLKKLDEGKHRIQVGIFADKTLRPLDKKANGPTNAEIGLVHEMGSVERRIPRRSFLWDTFSLHGAELEKGIAPLIPSLFDKGNIDEYLKRASHVCTDMVIKAFMTSGWGSWPQNSYETIMRKLGRAVKNLTRRRQLAAEVLYEGAGHTQPLIDKGELWQSVSARTVRA